MEEGRRLAVSAADLRYEDVSEEVLERAKDLVLNQLGIQLAMSDQPWSQAVLKYVRGFGATGESTIVRYGDRVRAENAAFANGTFGHGFELDDTYLPGNVHPGAVVIPAVLALGEPRGIDGKAFLVSVVAGYEVVNRIGRGLSPSCLSRGFHPTLIVGPMGAAVAAGKVLGFDAATMLNGMAIASSHASGMMEYTQTGGSLKRIHAGLAAFGGIRAAVLAQAGITGPPTFLEGKRGLCQAVTDAFDLSEVTSDLGQAFTLMEVSLKCHSVCFQIQAPIDATSSLIETHKIGAKDIEEIVVGTNREAITGVGAIVEPDDITAAQFSAPFSLAMCALRKGNSFRDYTGTNLNDPEIKAMAKKVRLEVDDEVQAAFPKKRAVRVTVKLKNGTAYQQRLEGARGTPVNPMARQEIEDKFRDMAALVLPQGRIEEILRIVKTLDETQTITALCKSLVVEGRGRKG
jgi:2-methylcitrate dehydratase PrpD